MHCYFFATGWHRNPVRNCFDASTSAKLGTAGKWREDTIGNFGPIGSKASADVGSAHTDPEYQCDREHNQGVLHSSLAMLFPQEFLHWTRAAP